MADRLDAPSFLHGHYKRFRDAGGDHAMYVVMNDIDDLPIANELRQWYEVAGKEKKVVD